MGILCRWRLNLILYEGLLLCLFSILNDDRFKYLCVLMFLKYDKELKKGM